MGHPMRRMRLLLRAGTVFAGVMAACVMTGCGGGSGGGSGSGLPVSVSLPVSSITVAQDGAPSSVNITINSSSETALVSVAGLPGGVGEKYAASDTNPSGVLTFTANSSSAAGTYQPTITVNSAGQTASLQFTLLVAPVVAVSNSVDTTSGVKGTLKQFMTTSFQVAEWSQGFFATSASAREATLSSLSPQHIRLQPLSQGIPMKTNTGAASDWDFTVVDQVVQPVLALADHSPEFQIAVAPAWMCDSSGHLDINNHLSDFTKYAANLVRYYNKGGFDVAGTHFQSPSSHAITWWGIFNEPNINGITAVQYVTLYNAVVPAMLAVDSTIRFSALEFSDFGMGTGSSGDPTQFLPAFLAPASAGGVKTQVDVLSTHFYGTCNQSDTDADLLATIPQFVDNVSYFYKELGTRPDLSTAQVWVTENNVNADYAASDGTSTCNPTQTFVSDPRGSSAFFAAWRPYVFSQLGKAGNQGLFHWDYSSDRQYGEVDANGAPYLSYWVDHTLANFYSPTTASAGPEILAESSTDTASIETLATRHSDGTVRVMIVDRAVHASTDNNGNGDPRTVIVDLSSFGNFTAASLLTVDANTNVVNGPAGVSIAPAPRITVTLNGYGVAFLSLMP